MTIFASTGRFLGAAYGRARRWFRTHRWARAASHWIRAGNLWVDVGGWTRKGMAKAAGYLALAMLLVPIVHGLFDIRMRDKKPSMHLLDRSYGFIAAIENETHEFGYWKMPDTLPQLLIMTTLAAEDRRFADHFGVDWRAVGGAVVNNYVHRGAERGASTLAMQVARLQHGGTSGWYWKLHDAVVATGITLFYGRDRVLAQYFRLAPYGNRIAGAACASRRYFHKPVQDLSLAECALLASLPKAPSRFNLFSDKGLSLAKRRAAMVLQRSVAYGWVPKSVVDGALSELATISVPELEHREESSYHFLLQCAKRLGALPHPTGEIRTTLDRVVQDTLFDIFRRNLPILNRWEANNTAAIVLDVRTGEVLGYLGSVDYSSRHGGAIDCANLPRSTGSLLKPFIYGLGMEWQGYTASTVLTDLDFDFGTGRNSFAPENSDRKFQGPVLYKNALANSRNIPAVQVLKSVGVDMFYRHCIALGLADDDGKAEYYGLGLSIGGLYSSLQRIAGAYLTLANQGVKKDLVWEATENTPPESDASNSVTAPVQTIPVDIAMQIKRFLSDPVARLPTFPRGGNLEYPFAVATKTGTSEGFRDSWCVAFSDRYLVAAWVGNTDFSPTKNLTGYQGAASLVKQVMYALHPDRTDGQSDVEFPPPPGYVPVAICKLTGKRADRLTPFVTTEYFRPGTEPVEVSEVSQMLPVDKSNGLLALPPCPVEVEYRRFTVLDPMYADWAKAQGLETPPERASPACGESAPVDGYSVAITSPRNGSRFFLDPEMPPGTSTLPVHVKIFPPPVSVLWMVDDREFKVVPYPFTLQLPMQPGSHTVQVVVPGTEFRSQAVKIEVF